MPLIKSKSKKSRNKNIKKELAAGKPLRVALGIAYSVQREARKRARKAYQKKGRR